MLPSASNLPTGFQMQFTKGRNDANLVLAPVAPDGWVDLLVQSVGIRRPRRRRRRLRHRPDGRHRRRLPRSLALSVAQPAKNSVTLSWQNPPDADLTGVTIRRVVDGVTTGDPFEGTLVAETTGTTFTDTNLTPGTTYWLLVWAHDAFPNVADPAEVVTDHYAARVVGARARRALRRRHLAPSPASAPRGAWPATRSGQVLTWNGTAWSAPSPSGAARWHR